MELVGYFLMEADACSIFKGKTVLALHIRRGMQYTEAAASGPGNVHNHVGVEIVAGLGGWELPLFRELPSALFEKHFCFSP